MNCLATVLRRKHRRSRGAGRGPEILTPAATAAMATEATAAMAMGATAVMRATRMTREVAEIVVQLITLHTRNPNVALNCIRITSRCGRLCLAAGYLCCHRYLPPSQIVCLAHTRSHSGIGARVWPRCQRNLSRPLLMNCEDTTRSPDNSPSGNCLRTSNAMRALSWKPSNCPQPTRRGVRHRLRHRLAHAVQL